MPTAPSFRALASRERSTRPALTPQASGRPEKLRFALGLLSDARSVIDTVSALQDVGIAAADLGILTGPSPRQRSKHCADPWADACDGVGHRIVCTCSARNPHFRTLHCGAGAPARLVDDVTSAGGGNDPLAAACGIEASLTEYLCRWATHTLANKRHCDRVVRHLGSGAPALIAIFRDDYERHVVCETLFAMAPLGVETHEISLTQSALGASRAHD